ncbi:kinesin-like protein KIN-14F isoform X2 [Vigna unguiculata]|nr:kinesin-like protein KIN-14F isoform X2 [Vigna unguiculata]XP_027938786.1 kinesin-like protein KIN-14F isoform X2 [Vigna unguiculata]
MPQESILSSIFASPHKRGLNLKCSASVCTNNEASYPVMAEESINDHELAQRKAEEAASRRYEAAEWLRQMDNSASSSLSKEPSEEEFCLALRNGLILCNVLNRVNPGAVVKVVDNAVVDSLALQSSEGPAQSAIQYFENMRNFLEAVNDMKLLTFEASDLEKGGSSSKVVDCILCLKGYYEWKLSGGVGVWRYGGTVRITSFPKWSPTNILGTESVDESESSQFLHLSGGVSIEETKAANALTSLFDKFGLKLLLAYLKETDGVDDLPLNAMVIDSLIRKVIRDFSALLDSQGTQLGHFLKKILKGDTSCLTKREFVDAITLYLNQRRSLASNEVSKLCTCGGKRDNNQHSVQYCAKHAEIIDAQQKELEGLRYFYEGIKLELKQIQSKWDQELNRLENHIKSLEEASSSYHKVLEENRVLYNQVQDLKGAIRVYCRVRPFLPGQPNGQSTVDYIGENGNIMIMNPLKQGKDARRVFSFNKVFATSATQEEIYADTQPLVRSALDGYNVCIFAYGQTGSGKTYTMSGPDLMTEETWGVNYRALRDLFHISKERADAIKYEVGVQMIEIYNEQVRDLLVSDGSNRRLDIRNNSQLNGLNVPDASLVPVNCTQDVLDLMKVGQRNRAVGATALNERSSRSHSVLTVHVRGRDLVSNSILKGCLHLVDLAGSERVDKSEAVGERLKEAQHINKSLSALGDVISALAQKSQHIPYRNSKLTQVLQDSLGGHAKTLMFVHINPELNALGETISTLKFAERVATIELGAAQSNKETGEIRELKEEISNIKSALERKETELQQWKAGNARNPTESQKAPRAVSPFRLPKNGTSDSMKPENYQRHMDDRSSEAKTCSSGKQRRSRFPSTHIEKESIPKMSILAEEKIVSSGNTRSPSPPVRRRSISTDRGSVIKSKVRSDTAENQPISKHLLPARVLVNKSLVTMPMPSSIDNNSRVNLHSQESVKQDRINETLFNLQKINSRKVNQEHEEEQLKQAALGVARHGGTRKNKVDNKSKVKPHQQFPFRIQKPDMTIPITDMEIGRDMTTEAPRKSNYCEPENDISLMESAVHGVNLKKINHNISRNFQNIGSRGGQAAEPLLSSKVENKIFQHGSGRNLKEGTNTTLPEFRRSRSTPRGKFFVLS